MWIKDLMDSLRVIAKDPSSDETGLLSAGEHVCEFIDQYGGDRQAGVSELMKAVQAEAEANPLQKKFWMAVHDFVILPLRFNP